MSTTRMRLERLVDERERVNERIEDRLKLAEDEQRDLNELEQTDLTNYRTRVTDLEDEINGLAGDLERAEKSRDVSALIRPGEQQTRELGDRPDGPVVYRTFAAYARDELLAKYPLIAAAAARDRSDIGAVMLGAADRLKRVQHTLSTDVAGITPQQYMAQILDIINKSRPVVATARTVSLDTGKLTYPRIIQRPQALKQTAEKTEGGTANMQIELDQLIADTYIGGGNLSWQTINWATPDALALWFDLAGEAYARQTEIAACTELYTDAGGTVTPPLGTTGTEDFNAWRVAVMKAIAAIYTNTGGRAMTNTLWLSADRFFSLAALGTSAVVQVSPVGQLDVAQMTGSWNGLRVVGSYGFNPNTAVVGDSNAFLVGETAGAPVELRTVEPAIGGMEVGVIGAFKSKVFDSQRFLHLN